MKTIKDLIEYLQEQQSKSAPLIQEDIQRGINIITELQEAKEGWRKMVEDSANLCDPRELACVMKEAQSEITRLRRRNEILEAKVEVMDGFMCVLHTSPAQHTQGFSSDVVFAMERQIGKLEGGQKPESA